MIARVTYWFRWWWWFLHAPYIGDPLSVKWHGTYRKDPNYEVKVARWEAQEPKWPA